MPGRPAIPKLWEKRLFQEVENRCPVCGHEDVGSLVIHHIVPFADAKAHRLGDLLVLCANCHMKADRGEITPEGLYEVKRSLAKVVPLRPRQAPTQTVIGYGKFTAGRDIHIQGPRKAHAPVIPDTVATDPYKIGYLRYLAKRYMRFKEHEVGKGEMRYPVIYQAYEREIGFSMPNTPLEKFEVACHYLQDRIENTRVGRVRRKQGQKVYSTYEEYLQRGEE